MEAEIVNRVEKSGLVTIDMKYFFQDSRKELIDIKDQLFNGIILREKDFRTYIKENDWSIYQDAHIAVHCSVDAIIPVWAYMLLASKLEPFVKSIVYGDLRKLEEQLFLDQINKMNVEEYEGKRVVIKGCSDIEVPESAFIRITERLRSVVTSIMYGEPCSTVPVYKKPRG